MQESFKLSIGQPHRAKTLQPAVVKTRNNSLPYCLRQAHLSFAGLFGTACARCHHSRRGVVTEKELSAQTFTIVRKTLVSKSNLQTSRLPSKG